MPAPDESLSAEPQTDFGQRNFARPPLATSEKSTAPAIASPRKTARTNLPRWVARGFLAAMMLGSALITWLSLPYFDWTTVPPFVLEKLPLRFEALWLAALRVHVAAAAICFPLCLVLMTRASQRRARLHRWLGRVTGVLVLFALLPSGAVLAFDAKGGWPVTLGFLLSASIVAGAMVIGVRAARQRELFLHARAMRHILGQMSVAVVSRIMIVSLDALGSDPELAYIVSLWLPVLASVAVVEWLSRRPLSERKPVERSERIRRESSPLAILVRVRHMSGPIARNGR